MFKLFLTLVLCNGSLSSGLSIERPLNAPKPYQIWSVRLNHKDPSIRKQAIEFWDAEIDQIGIDPFYLDQEAFERRAQFRKECEPVLSELIQVLKLPIKQESELNQSRLTTLLSILDVLGPKAIAAIPELKSIALNERISFENRIRAALTVLPITPENQPVGPIFLKVLETMPTAIKDEMEDFYTIDKQPEHDIEAAEQRRYFAVGMATTIFSCALIQSGHTKSEIPSLIKIAHGPYPSACRAIAISVIGKLEFDAQIAVPELRKLLKDDDSFLQLVAANSLLEVLDDESQISKIMPILKLDETNQKEIEQLFHESFSDQRQRQRKLVDSAQEGPFAADFLNSLLESLQYGSGFQRRSTIKLLGEIGPSAKRALPALRKALHDPDKDTRRMAAEAIQRIE